MAESYVNAFVDDRTSLLYLLRRDNDGKLLVKKTQAEYVTYHKKSDITPAVRRAIERDSGLVAAKFEGEWYRATWRSYMDRQQALQDDGAIGSHELPHYEADVHPVRRFLVDSNCGIQKPRRAFLDIETDSRLSFAKLKAGEGRILCWAIVGEDGIAHKGVLKKDTDAAERELMHEMLDALDDYDQIVAWNGDNFDYLVIKGDRRMQTKGRLARLNIRYNLKRWLWIDHLSLYKRMNSQVASSGDEKQSFALHAIATAELGEGKDPFNASKCWEAWEITEHVDICPGCGQNHEYSPRECLVKYNLQDTDLLRKLEDKTGFLALLDAICDACGTFPDARGMLPSNQIDPYVLRLGKTMGMHFATKEPITAGEFDGAYVMNPEANGILKNVHVCDFKSMYPSMIVTWNMSPEMLVPNSRGSTGPILPGRCRVPITGVEFYTDRGRGLLAQVVSGFMALRAKWDHEKSKHAPGTPEWADANRKSNAYKVCGNSTFGVAANESCRFYNRDVAESITQAGVYLIQQTRDYLATHGVHIVYCHTDSSFAIGTPREQFAKLVKENLNGELYPKIATEHHCLEENYLIKLEYEKEFASLVFVGKNWYAGRYAHYKGKPAVPDSKPEIKGLEFKRGDSLKIARRLQERVIRMLLGDWDGKCPKCNNGVVFDKKFSAGKEPKRFFVCQHCRVFLEQKKVVFDEPVEVPADGPGLYRDMILDARDFVMNGRLRKEHVTINKTLKRGVDEYVVKKRRDGTDQAQPIHVQIAKVLLDRGADATEGTKISYVVTDGSDGLKAIPADDYTPDTQIDRFYLWENLIWPPTERVLAAAAPHVNWDRMFGKVRPMNKKPKRGGAGPGQMAFDFTIPQSKDAAVPSFQLPLVIIKIDEQTSTEKMTAIKDVLLQHPGNRSVQIIINMDDGSEVVLKSEHKVTNSPELRKALSKFEVKS